MLSSAHSKFVDLRFVVDPSLDRWGMTRKHVKSLYWGFAGESKRETRGQDTVGIWSHWVDSRFAHDSFSDSGILKPHLLTPKEQSFPKELAYELEIGSMTNLDSGVEQRYEEIWADIEVHSGGVKQVCAVIRLNDDQAGTRGLIVRVGEWCQGIMKTRSGDVAADRCRWDAHSKTWTKLGCFDATQLLPTDHILHNHLNLGETFRYKDFLWTVEELDGVEAH